MVNVYEASDRLTRLQLLRAAAGLAAGASVLGVVGCGGGEEGAGGGGEPAGRDG